MRALGREWRVRRTDTIALGLLGVAAAMAALAGPHLPAEVRIHWTVGDWAYHGVETVPKAVGLALLPTLGAMLYGLGRVATRVAPLADALGDDRWIIDATVLATLGVLVVVHGFVLWLNL